MSEQEQTVQNTEQEPKEKKKKVKVAVKDAIDAAKDVVETTKDVVEDIVEETVETVKEVVETVKDAAKDFVADIEEIFKPSAKVMENVKVTLTHVNGVTTLKSVFISKFVKSADEGETLPVVDVINHDLEGSEITVQYKNGIDVDEMTITELKNLAIETAKSVTVNSGVLPKL
jgi:phage-related protein